MYINGKMVSVETSPGVADEGEQWRGKFKYDISDIL
jgi:hypothetical protein